MDPQGTLTKQEERGPALRDRGEHPATGRRPTMDLMRRIGVGTVKALAQDLIAAWNETGSPA